MQHHRLSVLVFFCVISLVSSAFGETTPKAQKEVNPAKIHLSSFSNEDEILNKKSSKTGNLSIEKNVSCHKQGAINLLGAYSSSNTAKRVSAKYEPNNSKNQYHLEVLFAILPESHNSNSHEVELDSIVNAIQDAGYVQDRYWLPWQDVRHSGGDHDSIDSGQYSDPCSHESPGVVLFRSIKGTELLFLYIITETPTYGIDKDSFYAAVDESIQLLNNTGSKLRIVGPTYSGSATSLKIAIEAETLKHPDLSFKIISGSATSDSVDGTLNQNSLNIEFHRTVIPDVVANNRFYRYLSEQLGASCREIAILTESTTRYGQSIISSEPTTCPRLVLGFPMNIAGIRQEWSKHPPASRENKFTTQSQVDQLEKAQDSTALRDVLPQISEPSIRRKNLALRQILNTISTERIRYAGLFSTNTQDKIFLAEQIRKYCPDVVLFTSEADILFTQPEYRNILNGMFVVSTYPLYNRNQIWSFPGKGKNGRMQFVTNASQGIYNATTILLGRPFDLIEYSPPSPIDGTPWRINNLETDVHSFLPPIWISAIGNSAIVPLAAFSDYDIEKTALAMPLKYFNCDQKASEECRLKGELTVRSRVPYAGKLNLSIYLLIFLSLAIVLICSRYFIINYSPSSKYFHESVFFNPQNDENQPNEERSWLHFLGFCLLAWLYGLLLLLFMVELRPMKGASVFALDSERNRLFLGHELNLWLLGLLFSTVYVILGASIFDVLFPMRSRKTKGWRALLAGSIPSGWREWFSISMLAGLVPVVFLLAFALLNILITHSDLLIGEIDRPDRYANIALWFMRTVHLQFGLSSILPFCTLNLAIVFYVLARLRQNSLMKSMSGGYDFNSLDINFGDFVSKIRNGLHGSIFKTTIGRISAVFGLISVLYWGLNWLFMLEGPMIKSILQFMFSAVAMITVFSLFRFFNAWRQLSEFLKNLAHHPITNSFSRLPDHFAKPFSTHMFDGITKEFGTQTVSQHAELLINMLDRPFIRESSARTVESGIDNETKWKTIREILNNFLSENEMNGLLQIGKQRTGEFLTSIIRKFWSERPLSTSKEELANGIESNAQIQGTLKILTATYPDAFHVWVRLAEDLIAIEIVIFLVYVLQHLRNLIVLSTASSVMLIVSLNLYPFNPHEFLSFIFWLLLLVVTSGALIAFVQMNRDHVLSRIARTEPGQLTFDRSFVSYVVFYAGLPFLGLITTEFPVIGIYVSSWVQSLSNLLK